MENKTTIDAIINMVSYGATLLAFAAVVLLLYLVFTELFSGKRNVFSFSETSKGDGKPKWYLPVISAASLWTLYLILFGIKKTTGSEIQFFEAPDAGFFSLYRENFVPTQAIPWIAMALSLCGFILAAVIIERESGDTACTLFCLSPGAMFMVLPGSGGLIAFSLVMIFYGFKKRRIFMYVPALAMMILLHVTDNFNGRLGIFTAEELIIIACIALLYIAVKCFGEKSHVLIVPSAILCGIVPAVYFLMK